MIIYYFNVVSITSTPFKTYTPLIINTNTTIALSCLSIIFQDDYSVVYVNPLGFQHLQVFLVFVGLFFEYPVGSLSDILRLNIFSVSLQAKFFIID